MAAHERSSLADLAEELGPDAPTLCEGWAVRDLVAHLVERESGSPAGFGAVVPAVRRHLERRRVRRSRGDFAALVSEFRSGPPRLSYFSLPGSRSGDEQRGVLHPPRGPAESAAW